MTKFNNWCRILTPFSAFILTSLLLIITGSCDKTEVVPNKEPSCSIKNPKDGDEKLKGLNIPIDVAASDADGDILEVKIIIDHIEVATIYNFPFQYPWNTDNAGTSKHTIKAIAKDNNNSESSSGIEIYIIDESSIILETGTVNDYDENTYKSVKIGNQWWMAENLKTTHYSDGTEIPLVENQEVWNNLGFSDKAFCYYNNSISNAETFGALYSWAAAMNGAESSEELPSMVKGVCPDGWHLPSDPEWIELEIQLGMSQEDAWRFGWRGLNEGTKMKTKEGWDNNGNGTNSSGFSALPAGIRSNEGLFSYKGEITHYWSSTEYINITDYAFNRELSCNQPGVGWFRARHYYGYPKDFGFSVRCVKD